MKIAVWQFQDGSVATVVPVGEVKDVSILPGPPGAVFVGEADSDSLPPRDSRNLWRWDRNKGSVLVDPAEKAARDSREADRKLKLETAIKSLDELQKVDLSKLTTAAEIRPVLKLVMDVLGVVAKDGALSLVKFEVESKKT